MLLLTSKKILCDYIAQGNSVAFIFFWGHHSKNERVIDKSCLSLWYPAAFTIQGIYYATAEHYMMAEKARLFGDAESVDKILAAISPQEVKLIGRRIKKFDSVVWEQRRYEIVKTGNRAKFSQHVLLQEFLIETQDKILVEASPYDTIWGIGCAADDNAAIDPHLWKGLNLLGFALMEIR